MASEGRRLKTECRFEGSKFSSDPLAPWSSFRLNPINSSMSLLHDVFAASEIMLGLGIDAGRSNKCGAATVISNSALGTSAVI